MRKPSKERKITIDPLVPVGETLNTEGAPSCFGKAWDISESACHQCADRDVCGILYSKVVDQKAEELRNKVMGNTYYLDEAEFGRVTEASIKEKVQDGDPVNVLIEAVIEIARCSDVPSVITFLKEYVPANSFISTKNGAVCLR